LDDLSSSQRNMPARVTRRGYAKTACLLAVLALAGQWFAPPRASAGSANDEVNIEKYAIRRVKPPYPPNAVTYRIEGAVTVRVTVAPNGTVSEAEFVRGQTVFRNVSLDAAKRWVFKSPANESLKGVIHFVFKLEDDK